MTKVTSEGHSFETWERYMPRLPSEFTNSVVYMYPSELAADEGKKVGGTGFIVSVPSSRIAGRNYYYIVTNAHVYDQGGIVARGTTIRGEPHLFNLDANDWHLHPDIEDVAIASITTHMGMHQFESIPEKKFASKKDVERELIIPGTDVFMVGRFSEHDGATRNLPTMRFGNIAMLPLEPIYQNDRHHYQESFLVEMRSISGFSGSPVIAYHDGKFVDFENEAVGMFPPPFIRLLGINWGHLNLKTGQNTNMAGVVPAWIIRDLLYSGEVLSMREEDDKN